MAVTKTIVFQTAPCSSSFVLLVRVVSTILRCSFPVCWSRAKDIYHLQLAKFLAAERIGWSSDPVQSHPNELYLVLKNCYGKRSGSALTPAFSFLSVIILFYLSSIFVSKGGNFAPDKNSWAQLVGKSAHFAYGVGEVKMQSMPAYLHYGNNKSSVDNKLAQSCWSLVTGKKIQTVTKRILWGGSSFHQNIGSGVATTHHYYHGHRHCHSHHHPHHYHHHHNIIVINIVIVIVTIRLSSSSLLRSLNNDDGDGYENVT